MSEHSFQKCSKDRYSEAKTVGKTAIIQRFKMDLTPPETGQNSFHFQFLKKRKQLPDKKGIFNHHVHNG